MEQSENPLIKTFIRVTAGIVVLVVLYIIWKRILGW